MTNTTSTIALSQGKFAIIDTFNLERLQKYAWHYHLGYAAHNTGVRKIMMHHLVVGILPEELEFLEVHHVNDNKLDNRRANLKVLTFSEHQATRSKQSNNTSGYKGVRWCDPSGRQRVGFWRARIGYQNSQISIGSFKTAEEAARAYDKKAKELFGKAAYLNFPND